MPAASAVTASAAAAAGARRIGAGGVLADKRVLFLCQLQGGVPIQRVIHRVKEVNSGRNYLIFPEGTRSKSSNDLLEFHNGSFRCALKTKCAVVPVALVDCYKVLDQKGSKPVTVQIHYLPPIEYGEYGGMNTKELAALVRSRIEEKVKASL